MRHLKSVLWGFILFSGIILYSRGAFAAPSHCPYDINCSIWYTKLTKDQQILVDRVYDAYWEGKKEASVPERLSDELVEKALECFSEDMGEICCYGGFQFKDPYRLAGAKEGHRKLTLLYNKPYAAQKPFIDRVSEIASEMSDIYDVYEYICEHTEYEYKNDHDILLRADTFDSLKTGKAVCSGYAHMMSVLCHFLGIECSYVVGDAVGDGNLWNHAWNVVKIDGKFTYVDATWDDYGDYAGYDWFGLSGGEMNRRHNDHYTWWVPACVSLKSTGSAEKSVGDSGEPVASAKYGRNSYDVYDLSLSWDEAEEFCRDKGGHLVSIRDLHEMDFVERLAKRSSKDQIWIGLHRGADNKWEWTDGSKYFYSRWDEGQPDNYLNKENCVRFSTRTLAFEYWTQHAFRWVDTASEGDDATPISSFGFVCETEH